MLIKAIEQEPLAIFFVDSNISIYNELCELAFSKNKSSVRYMNINRVSTALVFEILKDEPERFKYLNRNKGCYNEACKMVLSLNGSLIKYVYYPNLDDNLDQYFELITIAEKSNPEIADSSDVLYALCLYNRKRKQELLNTSNILGNNIFKLLDDLDDEYELLLAKYVKALEKPITSLRDDDRSVFKSSQDCPIKCLHKKSN